jgi:serine protease AprX
MMKVTLTLIFVFLLGELIAQNENSTYIIKLKDKGQSLFSITNPTTFLSERAIERRLLQQIPVDESDLPVNPEYIDQIKEFGAQVIYISKWLNTIIVKADKTETIVRLQKLPFIKEISPSEAYKTKKNNQPFKKFFQQERYNKFDIKTKGQTSPPFGFNYGPSANQAQMIKVDELHNQGFTGNGITIAVIDAGFNSVNILDAFDSLFIQNKILGTRDFVEPGNNVYNTDLSLHGTMVLSTMGGNLPGELVGTAPHASFYLFRTEDATAEYLMEEYYWVQAAEYADSLGVDILSTSLGYTQFDNPAENHTYEDLDGNTTIITIGADLAAKKGMLVVNSAGNEGDGTWKYISAPADGDSVLAIGAVFPDGTYAPFSSVGPTPDGRIKPDIATQGVYTIVAIVPSGVSQGSGTSFACPIMSGAAACLWQANPTYSNMEIFNAIKASANKASNPDNFTGWGIPDFVKANSLLVGEIDKINYSDNIYCYPNPFNDFLIADFNNLSMIDTEIRLLTTRGEVIRSFKVNRLNQNKNQFRFTDLNDLPKGIYFVQVTNTEGTTTQKVIK